MILTGDALEILPTLEAESAQTVVTSPPYYGLRDYGLPPTIWDAVPGCRHEWGEERVRLAKPDRNTEGKDGAGNGIFGTAAARGSQPAKSARGAALHIGPFCVKCGAWRGSLGLEPTPELYVKHLVQIFREVCRVLRDDGTVWLNLGDSYAGGNTLGRNDAGRNFTGGGGNIKGSGNPGNQGSHARITNLKPKDLIGIPWRTAFALQADGWYLRQDIIWHKPNPMPESVIDRCTKAHEYIFLLTKSARYYFDHEAIRVPFAAVTLKDRETDHYSYNGKSLKAYGDAGVQEPLAVKQRILETMQNRGGANRRSVWTITTKPFKEAHFATFPPEIPEICIKAGTSEKGCCPECGSPWERIGEKVTLWRERPNQYTAYRDINGQPDQRKSGSEFTTTGWRPTCTHNLDPVPCTVLDPFSGAGTTGMVATKLGRKYIGIELNPEYSEMSEKRIEAVRLPLFR